MTGVAPYVLNALSAYKKTLINDYATVVMNVRFMNIIRIDLIF